VRRAPTSGNGDTCPVDESHGRMWVLPSGRQFCPNQIHRGRAVYEHDGVTPAKYQRPGKAA
jgi:hypothetical protein